MELDPYTPPRLNVIHSVTVKLTESNYILWKRQFEAFLSAQNMLGFVTGSTPQPVQTLDIPNINGTTTPVPNPDHPLWFQTDQVIQSWLLGSFSEEIQSVVLQCTTSQQIWMTLANHFNRASSSRLFELQRKLQTISKGEKPMQDYLREIKSICDQLTSIGSPVPDRMKIFAALLGLGREYEPIKTSIEGTMDGIRDPTFDDVVPRLKSFEDRLKGYSADTGVTTGVTPHLAFNSTRGRPYFSRNRGRGRGGRDFFSTKGRGFPQHLSSATSSSRSSVSSEAESRPVCQICGKTGHIALKCWHRFNPYEDVHNALAAMRIGEIQDTQGHEWFPDTGASAHITNSPSHLQNAQAYLGSDSVMVGNGEFLPITHTGSASICSSSGNLPLKDVLVCPNIAKPLLSVSKFTKDYPCAFDFDCNNVFVYDKATKKVLLRGRNTNGLYKLRGSQFQAFYTVGQVATSDEIWHKRLGHPNPHILQYLSSSKAISINKSSKGHCEACKMGKSTRLPFEASSFRTSRPLERIHCDLWGPAPVTSVQGFIYYVVFIDNFSRHSWLFPLKKKSDFYSVFVAFQTYVENQYNASIGSFQCDGGGEFVSNLFLTHLQQSGIKQLISCPHTPQQNGLAERKHRQVTEMALSLMFHSQVPHRYWVEAFFTANYLSNLLPHSALADQKTPFEILHNRRGQYSSLKAFGCACFPTLRDYSRNKFDPRSLKCVFLGYSEKFKGYRCLMPSTGRVYISRHVTFDEDDFPFSNDYSHLRGKATTPLMEAWHKSHPVTEKQQNTTSPSDSSSTMQTTIQAVVRLPTRSSETPSVDEPQTSNRRSEPPISASAETADTNREVSHEVPVVAESSRLARHGMITRSQSGITKPNPKYGLLTEGVVCREPKTIEEALSHPGWNKSVHEEYDNCMEAETWSLVPYKPDTKVLGNRWIHRIKLNADGSIKKLRSRLVVQGNTQEEGVDYLETYSPVVRTATVRMVLHLATVLQWDIKQMDVTNAFLHGDLTEIVYMRQPAGFVDKSKPDHVCLLHKSLYGLKQSPRAWFDKFSGFLLEFGFKCSIKDPSLFVYSKGKDVIMLLLYVDDMLITGNQSTAMKKFINDINNEFRMKDMGRME